MQPQPVFNRSVGLATDFLKTAEKIYFFACFAFFQKTCSGFHRASFDTYKTVELKNRSERVANTLLYRFF